MQTQARDGFQVLDWIMSRHVHEYLDVAGRPVGEGRAAVFQDVKTEMRSCPYAGSRYRQAKPMNFTALQQMPPWPHVLTMLAWLSQRYRARNRTDVTTCDHLGQVTSAGVFLVDFLVLRRNQPLRSHEIPLLISGLYKVCLGFQLAYLPERFTDQTAATPLPDPAGFLAYLEASELLIGEAEVCSGSPAMILQAYEAVVGRQAVAKEILPPPCATLEIDWEQYDAFLDHASAIWRGLVLFVMRMPQFLPELAGPQLPSEVQQRLNSCLKQHGAQLLADQVGLVVDIARGVQEFGESHARTLVAESPSPIEASFDPQPGTLAATVLTWLGSVAGADMETYAPVVSRELQARLGAYDVYEAGVLAQLNQHLGCIMQALGFERGAAITASALSRVCGRTLRDWLVEMPEAAPVVR
jgi:hypothetical protein